MIYFLFLGIFTIVLNVISAKNYSSFFPKRIKYGEFHVMNQWSEKTWGHDCYRPITARYWTPTPSPQVLYFGWRSRYGYDHTLRILNDYRSAGALGFLEGIPPAAAMLVWHRDDEMKDIAEIISFKCLRIDTNSSQVTNTTDFRSPFDGVKKDVHISRFGRAFSTGLFSLIQGAWQPTPEDSVFSAMWRLAYLNFEGVPVRGTIRQHMFTFLRTGKGRTVTKYWHWVAYREFWGYHHEEWLHPAWEFPARLWYDNYYNFQMFGSDYEYFNTLFTLFSDQSYLVGCSHAMRHYYADIHQPAWGSFLHCMSAPRQHYSKKIEVDARPYMQGRPCTKCPEGMSRSAEFPGLCDFVVVVTSNKMRVLLPSTITILAALSWNIATFSS